MKMPTVLFVGRLQPLHKGHVHAIKNLFKKYDKIVIAVGSINKKNAENPFTFQERKAMLNASLKKYKNRYRIIGIADRRSDVKWKTELIRRGKIEESDIVVTANPWTARCFSDYNAIKPKLFNPKKYNATRIRKLINENKEWKGLVPKQIVQIIKKHFSRQ